MAWRAQSTEDAKQKFVLLHQTGRFTMVDLCRRFGISRPTGYAILSRYESEGWEGPSEQSRRPHRSPNRVGADVEDARLELRREHRLRGARKLMVPLRRKHPDWDLPCESTVNNILKKHGMVTPRKKRRWKLIDQNRFFDPSEPNQIWSADFKGKFRLGNYEYCYPLTIADLFIRYLVAIQGLEYTRTEDGKPIIEKAFRECGMPEQLHTDNGPPFGAPNSQRRLSGLAVWFIDLGITPVHSDPDKPQQNGRHERMHRDLKAQATRPAARGWISQQRKFNYFRAAYNDVRPHESLDMRSPTEVHRKSEREYSR